MIYKGNFDTHIEIAILKGSSHGLAVNVSSIVYISFSTEENIHGTNHVCIVLILSRTEFQKYSKNIGSICGREVILLYRIGYNYSIPINSI